MGYEQALELQTSLLHRVATDPLIVEMADRLLGIREENPDGDLGDAIECGLRDGSPIYWSPEMSTMLEDIAEQMPTWTLRREALPIDRAFIYFAQPLMVPPVEGLDVRLRVIAYEVVPEYDALKLFYWYERTDGPKKGICYPSHPSHWVFGQDTDDKDGLYDEMTPGHQHLKVYARYFAAALALMEQTIVGRSVERAPRATRRRLGEAGETPIQVIHLRRTVRTASADDDHEKAYELTCQFVVRMHWRQQYHPSDGSHRPKLIAPYVKGPEGAPMKVHADRIFVVDR